MSALTTTRTRAFGLVVLHELVQNNNAPRSLAAMNESRPPSAALHIVCRNAAELFKAVDDR